MFNFIKSLVNDAKAKLLKKAVEDHSASLRVLKIADEEVEIANKKVKELEAGSFKHELEAADAQLIKMKELQNFSQVQTKIKAARVTQFAS